MIAGRKDALSLLSMGAAATSALPFFSQAPGLLYPTLAAGSLGAGWLTYKTINRRLEPARATNREGFVLKSDRLFPEIPLSEGLKIGYTTDFNQPLYLPNDILSRHMEIVGMTGVGKTVLGEYLLWQQMQRGGGWMFIDAKLDTDTRDKLYLMACKCGRADDFMVINTDDPAHSNTYNPILDGDGDEIASRLLTLIPSTDNNPGADHYKQTAAQAISTLINGLKRARRSYTFGDLALLLQSSKAIEEVLRICPKDTPEYRAMAVFFDQFKMVGEKTSGAFDIKRIKETFGGISGRIGQFANGNFGQIFNHYYPDVNLFDVIRGNKMLYVMLPTMSKNIAALNLGKMMVSDLRTACAKLQNLPSSERPNPPFLAFLDEFGSYVEASISALFEQARSAGISLAVGMQSFANLKTVSEDFAEKVNQNTLTKVFFKFSSQDAENASEIIGTGIRFSESISVGGSEGESNPILQTAPSSTESDSHSMTVGYRETEVQRVTQDQLKSLERGQCIVYSNARVFHIKTAMLKCEEKTFPKFVPIHINAAAMAEAASKASGGMILPAMLEQNFQQFLTTVAPNYDRGEEKSGSGKGSGKGSAGGDQSSQKPRAGVMLSQLGDEEALVTSAELKHHPEAIATAPDPEPTISVDDDGLDEDAASSVEDSPG